MTTSRKSSTALATTMAALLLVAPAWAQTQGGGGQGAGSTEQNDQAETQTQGEPAQSGTQGGPAPEGGEAEGGQSGASGATLGQNDQAETQTQGETAQAGTQGGPAPTGDAVQGSQAEVPDGGPSDMSPMGQVGQMGGSEQMMMLDMESFAQDVYERGFRQGYLRGAVDARQRFMADMSRFQDQMRGRDGGMSNRMGQQGDRMSGGGMERLQGDQQSGAGQGGTVIVLPPGVTPQMFLDRIERMNEDAQRN